jgi:hypothetical protein
MPSQSVYFPIDPGIEPSQEQLQVHARLTDCLSKLRPTFLEAADTSAYLNDDSTLSLNAIHAKNTEVEVTLNIDEDGRLGILCDSLHRSFELCFNDIWEPDDCLGDLDTAIEVVQALFSGKMKSRVVFARSGESIAKSDDYLIDDRGKPVKLYTQYHGQGIADALLHRRCEIRRVSFDEEMGMESIPCSMSSDDDSGWWDRVKRILEK